MLTIWGSETTADFLKIAGGVFWSQVIRIHHFSCFIIAESPRQGHVTGCCLEASGGKSWLVSRTAHLYLAAAPGYREQASSPDVSRWKLIAGNVPWQGLQAKRIGSWWLRDSSVALAAYPGLECPSWQLHGKVALHQMVLFAMHMQLNGSPKQAKLGEIASVLEAGARLQTLEAHDFISVLLRPAY